MKTDWTEQWGQLYLQQDEPTQYGNDVTSYRRAGIYLGGPGIVRDWGCGSTFFRNFCGAPYEGVDGAVGSIPFGALVRDLRTAKFTPTPKAHMRHVLEHNWEWRIILRNFMNSFTDRAVITLFLPLSDGNDKHDPRAALVEKPSDPPGLHLSKLSFFHNISVRVPGCKVHSEEMHTDVAPYNWEQMFFLEKEM